MHLKCHYQYFINIINTNNKTLDCYTFLSQHHCKNINNLGPTTDKTTSFLD